MMYIVQNALLKRKPGSSLQTPRILRVDSDRRIRLGPITTPGYSVGSILTGVAQN